MEFTAQGHENILATHRTTLEFTKDDYVTLKGDCIVGIRAGFGRPKGLKGRILVRMECEGLADELTAEFNPSFDSHEMVIRRSDYVDERTFATAASKAAADLDRGIVRLLQQGKTINVSVHKI